MSRENGVQPFALSLLYLTRSAALREGLLSCYLISMLCCSVMMLPLLPPLSVLCSLCSLLLLLGGC